MKIKGFKIIWVCMLIALVFGLRQHAYGQLRQEARYEVLHDWSDINYVVVNNDKQGITVIQPKVKGSEPNYEIKFSHLDKDLTVQWSSSFKISRQMNLLGYHYANRHTYLLFQNRVNPKFLQLVSLNLDQHNVIVFKVVEVVPINIQYFEMVQNTAIVGGYSEDKPVVIALNSEDGSVNTLENIYQPRGELAEVRVNKDSVTFNVLISVLNSRKEKTIEVHTYDFRGDYIRGYQLDTKPEYQLLTGVSSSVMDKAQVVAGLYTTKNGSYPSGLFVHHIDKMGKQNIKYINFGEFDTFLNHMGARRANRLKEKARGKLKRSKNWRFKTDVFFRPMLETTDELMVLAEFFKPWSFSTERYNLNRIGLRRYATFNSGRENPYQPLDNRNYQAPREFDFTHAFALSLNLSGEVNWDRSLTINKNHEGLIDEYGGFQWYQGEVYYSYYHRRELVAGHLNAKETDEISTELKLMENDEELKFDLDETFDFTRWYDNYLLIHGVQRVKAANKNGEIRRVFFVNKLGFEPHFENAEVKKE